MIINVSCSCLCAPFDILSMSCFFACLLVVEFKLHWFFFPPENSKKFSSSSSLSSIFAFLEVVAGFPFLSPTAPGVGTLEEGEFSKWKSFLDCWVFALLIFDGPSELLSISAGHQGDILYNRDDPRYLLRFKVLACSVSQSWESVPGVISVAFCLVCASTTFFDQGENVRMERSLSYDGSLQHAFLSSFWSLALHLSESCSMLST